MLPDARKFTVIEACTTQLSIVKFKPQGMNQVQGTAGIRTKAYDIAGVRWYLGLIKNNMEHMEKNLCDCINGR